MQVGKAVGKTASLRASVSVPPELGRMLEEISTQKMVSLAWVVRNAAEQYVAGKRPMFEKQRT